jgi:DNA-binding response OmpR family regulator
MRTVTGSVLIVTADVKVGEGIHLALQRLGMTSVLAPQAAEAVRWISQDAPAAILIDLRFPDMDPEQVVRRAAVCRETHGSPIVALGDDRDDRVALTDLGCTAVIARDTKPADIAGLLEQLVRRQAGEHADPTSPKPAETRRPDR